MCGIYGTTLQYSLERVKDKLELMNFRGPDHLGIKRFKAQGSNFEDELTLGHVRLSIIDLDSRSNQPFEYNENISIVFNGEIYNYKELKKQYLADVAFRTESDTEVICAMYEKYGSECVNYFNGMFAYVIYDKRKNILVGARDRLGKKPFYYWHTSNGLEFASQVKCIAYGNRFTIDETVRALYLLHGYIPDPYCIYKEIRKLRAGEFFIYDLDSKDLNVDKYWDINSNSCNFQNPKTYDEAKELVKSLLYDSVKIRLQADVPVGTFLSGGIDSSLVCAVVSKFNKNLCAYTAKFENKEFDESIYAVDTANHLGVPIKVCECTGEDLLTVFNDYLEYFDEPFADDSLIPTSLVAQKAREDVTVILGGDGGDELFYGYDWYNEIESRLHQYRKPYLFRKLMSPLYLWKRGYDDMIQSTQRDYVDVYKSLGKFCRSLDGAEKFDRIQLARLIPDTELLKNVERGVLAYSDFDMKFFLNAVNQKCDRATMRASLELRCPLLDYRLAEYSRVIPVNYQKGKYGLKTILKDILYESVPREMLERKKRGFIPPTIDWFRGDLKKEMMEIVSFENVNTLLPELDTSKIIHLRDGLIERKNNNVRALWTVYTYIKWYKKYC